MKKNARSDMDQPKSQCCNSTVNCEPTTIVGQLNKYWCNQCGNLCKLQYVRLDGYYWVRLNGEVKIAEWNSKFKEWFVTGNDVPFTDNEFTDIDEEPIK